MDTVVARGRRRSRRWWFLLALLVVVATLAWTLLRGPSIEPGTVLLMDLQAPVAERSEEGLVALLSPPSTDFVGLFRALELGAVDPRVVALMVKIAPGHLGPGKVEELRNLLERFRRASGKPIVAHVSAPDTLGYFLATAADEILLDKSTTLDTVGIRLSAFFLKDALAKLGVELDLVRVGQFKGAFEELALPGPTPAFEESMNSLADSIYMTIVEGIARARKLDLEAVGAVLDRSPLPPAEAISAKLVDRLVEGEDVLAWARARVPGAAHVATATEYLEAQEGARTAGVLAVVHVLGTIVEGETRQVPILGFNTGAATAVEALRGAADDPDVAGILLRIDSPGGIVSASEKIYHAVTDARKKKPVIASMGGAAASGGYYAACGAERIFAHAMTFTGSLGVFGGKVVIQDFLRDREVTVRTYPRGKRASLSDPTRTYSAEERLALVALLEDSYHRL
ncbi:MAG TPA: S49 family peptidase, partial [Planctomycetota bacterium]|nr:S49 family peptidase [Planctomycetota bacterium]